MNKVKRYGWIPDRPDQRDFRLTLRQTIGLPAAVDLRPSCPPVFDQGDLGSCTANAIVAAMMMAGSQGDPDAPPQPMLSRLFLYYFERVIEHSVDSDSGAMMRDGFKVIANKGCCLEDTWPYIIGDFAKHPDALALNEAASDKAVVYSRVDQTPGQMKAVLAAGYPIAVGFTVYESFESDEVAKTGIVPMPKVDESVLGGHAVLVVGYDNSQSRFLCRNSWGEGWGMKGYFSLPYDYLTNPDLADDFWTVSKVN